MPFFPGDAIHDYPPSSGSWGMWTYINDSTAVKVNLTSGSFSASFAQGPAQNQVRNLSGSSWVDVGVGAESSTILHIPVRIQGTGSFSIEPSPIDPISTTYALPVRNIPGNSVQITTISSSALPTGAAKDSTVRAIGTLPKDIFNNLITAHRANQIQIDFSQIIPSSQVTVTTTSTGYSTNHAGHARFGTGTGTSATVKAVSFVTTKYRPLHEVYGAWTVAFASGGIDNSTQFVGLFDNVDGFAVGYSGSNAGILYRNNSVDTFISASSFSIDKLDGSSTSSLFTRNGIVEALDWSKTNLFLLSFGWLGSAPIDFSVMSPDGEWVEFHKIKQPNTSKDSSITNPDLTLRLEIIKSGAGSTDLVIETGCWAAGTTSQLSAVEEPVSGSTPAIMTKSVIYAQRPNGSYGQINANSQGRLFVTNDAVFTEDSAHSSGDNGIFVFGVRNDSDVSRTSADGDYSPISVDLTGRVKVTGSLKLSEPITGSVSLSAPITGSVGITSLVTVTGSIGLIAPITGNVGLTGPITGAVKLTEATTISGSYPQPYGILRTSPEPSLLFREYFSGSLDEEQWKSVDSFGFPYLFPFGFIISSSVSIVSNQLQFLIGTGSNAFSFIESKPIFSPVGDSFVQWSSVVKFESVPITGTHRFWGMATALTNSYPNMINEGFGFEIDILGNLNAVAYVTGTRIYSSALTTPVDNKFHKYFIQWQSDKVYWYLNDFNQPISSLSMNYQLLTPGEKKLPVRFHYFNVSSSITSSFFISETNVSDTSHGNLFISDKDYPFRKLKIDSNGSAFVTGVLGVTGTVTLTNGNDIINRLESISSSLSIRDNLFSSLIKFEAQVGQELRRDEPSVGDSYHGRAADGFSTGSAPWEIVRFYKDTTTGEIIRTRYRNSGSWINRSVDWT